MRAMHIRIRYRSGGDDVTERTISVIIAEPPNMVHAFCHLRGEERTFFLNRIEEAIDTETGKVISDIWTYLGLPSLKPAKQKMPVFSGRSTSLSFEESRNQRKADKNSLFGRFKYEVISAAKRRQLWALFGNCCFHCGATESLELDHHVPQKLGGRLVPGNIVLLCAACNAAKRVIHPSVFYSAEELLRLEPILEVELRIFDFVFSWSRWMNSPRDYLLSLGATEEEINAVFANRGLPL